MTDEWRNIDQYYYEWRNCSDCGLFRACLRIEVLGKPVGDYPCRRCFEDLCKYHHVRVNIVWGDLLSC